jgi:uncharacterized protein (TIGR03067 family)
MARGSRTRTASPAGEVALQSDQEPSRLEDSWDEPEPIEFQARADLELLQGIWSFVAGGREAELLISGDRYTMRFADGALYMGRFVLTPNGRLGTMDMQIEEGPPRHKGKTALCLYELDGGTLRWCTAGPGRTERPTAFPALDHPQYLHLVFRCERQS